MKKILLIHLCLFLICSLGLLSQPYHIDKSKPEPRALELFDDPENEGVKLSSYEGSLGVEAQRFFIKGYSEYQPVDIFLFSHTDGEALEMQLVLATWADKQMSCNTGSEGYCQIKFRNYGGVGFDISGKEGVEYTLLIVVGKEVTPEFDSPFYKVSESDLDKLSDGSPSAQENEGIQNADTSSEGGMRNMILYVIAFFLLLIVILLGMMVLRKNKAANVLVILLLSVAVLQGQDANPEDGPSLEERIESVKAEFDQFKAAHQRVQRWQGAFQKIDELRKLKESFSSMRSSYEGLGACIASAPAFTSPRIPSFCENVPTGTFTSGASSYRESCANCFLEARREFNQVRFTLSRLETIYKCTKKMTTSAKAFGDTWSSATKSGLGWVVARKNIEDSEKRLEEAYDNKYAELMQRLHDSLIEMSVCEAKYGLVDWYDRFGFVYYEFMADRYKRSN